MDAPLVTCDTSALDTPDPAWPNGAAPGHARLRPDQIAGDYVGSGTGQIVRVDRAEVGGSTVAQVAVRWSDGATTRITVVGENGPHVCGSSHTG